LRGAAATFEAERQAMNDTGRKTDTFGATCPKYRFSELARSLLKLTGCLVAYCSGARRTEVARLQLLTITG
jgi:hypothetical protein